MDRWEERWHLGQLERKRNEMMGERGFTHLAHNPSILERGEVEADALVVAGGEVPR